ncbi:hypothetical protein CAPTEDRAFT_136717, partial [Capitella teleta]
VDVTNCEICERGDREDRLLLCDSCDLGFHLDCLTPALNRVPRGDWFCPQCVQAVPQEGQAVLNLCVGFYLCCSQGVLVFYRGYRC